MLLALRDFLSNKRQATLQEMAVHFQTSPETVRLWLEHWIRKGKVCRAPAPEGCGVRCVACQPSSAEVYCIHPEPLETPFTLSPSRHRSP